MKLKNSDKKRNRRRLRYGTLSTVLTAVVVAVFVLLNVFADSLAERYPLTWDLTADGAYTLSEECKEVVEAAKNEIEITLFIDQNSLSTFYDSLAENFLSYFSLDVSKEFGRLSRELETALAQINSISGDKIRYSFLDPNQNPAEFSAYEKYEVVTGDILFVTGERHRTSKLEELFEMDLSTYSTSGNYYFSSRIEKIFASNIHALQGENDRIVQVLRGHGEDEDAIASLKSLYELNGYVFEEINITGSGEFNKNAELMLIAAPSTDYSDAEIKKVRDWVFNKGSYSHHLMVFTHPTASCPNLYELLDVEYGIQVTDELIWETDDNRILSRDNYTALADIPDTQYTTHAVTTGELATPIARRLTTSWPAAKEQENTLANLGVVLNNYPETAKVIKLKDFRGSETPEPQSLKEDQYPLTTMIAAFIDSYNNNTQQAVQGTIVVSGCPDMTMTNYVQNPSFANEKLLLDVVNTMAGVEDAVTISSKAFDQQFLTYEQGSQDMMLYIFVVGVPALVLVVCLVIFLRRKYL